MDCGARQIIDFISILSIFVMACFVGYYVVWSVAPALHTPLMAVTNAISSVIIVGALVASAAGGFGMSKWLGLLVAAAFDKSCQSGIRAIPTLQLKQYRFSFTFEDPS
jgi:NAD(P) transhydrogenase subunit alpha